MERRVTRNRGINPRDLLIYGNAAASLNLNPDHSYAQEVKARKTFLEDCEALATTTGTTPQHFTTPNATFYKRYVVVKHMGESRAETDFPVGGYTTPSTAAKEIRTLLLETSLPVVCFVGEDFKIGKLSDRHCWCVTFWKKGEGFGGSVKDSNSNSSGAKVPDHLRKMTKIMGIKSVLLIPATNEEECSIDLSWFQNFTPW